MPSRRTRLAAVALPALLLAARAGAQSADPLCWRGRPLDRCRSFLLFEFSAPRHLVGSTLDPAVGEGGTGHRRWEQGLASQFVYDLGYMRNIDARTAVGGTLEVGVVMDDPHTVGLVGATARYRRWLGRHTSADGAVGLLRMPVGVVEPQPWGLQRVSVRRPALSADVRLGLGDLLGVGARAMVSNDGRGRTHHALFAGVSIGSTATAVTTGALVALETFYRAMASSDDLVVTPPR